MLQRKLVRESTAPAEFIDHCSKLVCSVCSVCGGSKLKDVNLIANRARCLNKKCEGSQNTLPGLTGVVALAPNMEAIWGSPGNEVKNGGTGEQSSGLQSASGFRWELFKAAPVGRTPMVYVPGIRECWVRYCDASDDDSVGKLASTS